MFFISKKWQLVVSVLNDISAMVKTEFFRVICYYANIKMIKFWHNSKTSVQTTVPLGISKIPSFDCVLKTLWHENNSAYINHQGDPEKITQDSKMAASRLLCVSFTPFSTISLQHQKKKVRESAVFLFLRKNRPFESDKVNIISWFLHRFWGKILNLSTRRVVIVQFSRESC